MKAFFSLKLILCTFLLTFSLVLAGCGDDAAQYYGAWKSVKNNSLSEKPDVYIFSKDTLTVGRNNETAKIHYEKHGDKTHVIVDKDGHTIFKITPVTDDKIQIEEGFLGMFSDPKEFVRITEEDAKAIIEMKVERKPIEDTPDPF